LLLHSFCIAIDTNLEKGKMNTKHDKVFLSLIFIFTLSITSLVSLAQIPDEIILSLKSGNSKVLASYFNENVELVVLENDNVYSRAQAEQIICNFFQQYHPEEFNVIHQGGREGAKYVIGGLLTKQGNFRVSFLLKQNGGKVYIHQLRIEKQG